MAGVTWYFESNVNRVRVVLLFIIVLDLIIATAMGGVSFRFVYQCSCIDHYCHHDYWISNGDGGLNSIEMMIGFQGSFVLGYCSVKVNHWERCIELHFSHLNRNLLSSPQLNPFICFVQFCSLIRFFAIIACMLLVYAVIGYNLFNVNGHTYNEQAFINGYFWFSIQFNSSPFISSPFICIIGDPPYECDGGCGDLNFYIFASFNSIPLSLLALFVLMTSQNYPDISMPAHVVSWLIDRL